MADDNTYELGRYLRGHRERAGLAIRQLAALVGVDHGYLVRLESGQKRNPSAELLHKLADVLELDASEVLAFIGVHPSSVLPPADIYFRKRYGLSKAEARAAADLIEERYGRQPKDKQPTKNEKGGER